MRPDVEMVNLLYWIRGKGLAPVPTPANDVILNPLTRKLQKYGSLELHQKDIALWIPTIDGLGKQGIKVELKEEGSLSLVYVETMSRILTGVGPSTAEAILSFLNQVRLRSVAA